ncbi:hypothetical protein D3C87_1393770 [compost metagenome]
MADNGAAARLVDDIHRNTKFLFQTTGKHARNCISAAAGSPRNDQRDRLFRILGKSCPCRNPENGGGHHKTFQYRHWFLLLYALRLFDQFRDLHLLGRELDCIQHRLFGGCRVMLADRLEHCEVIAKIGAEIFHVVGGEAEQ